jgi:isocitrate/isopropylmalate dehydrogenase
MTKKVCVVKGDDASPEVVVPTVRILEQMGLDIEFLWPLTGDEAIAQSGDVFPQSAKEMIDGADCTITGSTRNLAHVHGYLRWGRKCFANLRPTKYVKGLRSPLSNPEGIDFVIVRENLEGLYPGWEGNIDRLAPLGLTNEMLGTSLDTTAKGKFAVKVTTEQETLAICHAACRLAQARKAAGGTGKVTVSSKYNVLTQSDEMFRRIAEETVARYPELSFHQLIIDNFAQQLIINPQQFDVVVMSNEHGDVLADGAAALIGGLGIAPNACIGDDYAYFGSVHGTAPDISGMDIINPTAMLLAAVMMLEHLGFKDEATRLETAVYKVYQDGKYLTRDQGGNATTSRFCETVVANLAV